MNYLKIYCNLIRKAENRIPPEGYTEKHHTFPVSIYGKNNRIVVLTAKEHFILHLLLEKICIKRYGLNHRKTKKMINAVIFMKGKGKYFNSYLYERSKIRFSMSISGENNPFYGKKHTEETIQIIKEKIEQKYKFGEMDNKGKKNPMWGRTVTEETKRKISEAHKKNPVRYWLGKKQSTESNEKRRQKQIGRKHTEETKEKMRGKNNSFYGQTHTPEAKEKIRQSRINKTAEQMLETYIKFHISKMGYEPSEEQKQKKLKEYKKIKKS